MEKEKYLSNELPSLKIENLSIWVGKTNDSGSVNEIFGHSVNVAIKIEALNSKSFFERRIFIIGLLDEFNKFQQECTALYSGIRSKACLSISHGEDSPYTPSVYVEIKTLDRFGHLSVSAESNIPDITLQLHKAEYPIDQSYLPDIINSCDRISKHLKLLNE